MKHFKSGLTDDKAKRNNTMMVLSKQQSPQSKGDNFCPRNWAHDRRAIAALSNGYKTPKPAALGKPLDLPGPQLPQSSRGRSGLTPSGSVRPRWFWMRHVVPFSVAVVISFKPVSPPHSISRNHFPGCKWHWTFHWRVHSPFSPRTGVPLWLSCGSLQIIKSRRMIMNSLM